MSDESSRRAAEEAAAAAEKAAAAARDAAEAARKAAREPGEPDDAGSDESAPRPGEGAQDSTPFAPTRGTDRTTELGMGEGGL